MEDHLRLSAKERKTCLATYRAARQARRALILLLLAEGRSYREIMAGTLAGPAMISAVKKDWQADGVARVLGTEERSYLVPYWLIVVVRSPAAQDAERLRLLPHSLVVRLVGAAAVAAGEREHQSRNGATGAGADGVRLASPATGRGTARSPAHGKLRRIQELIAKLPTDEAVVFQDEVDVHLNPKIGCCWMIRGQQAEVVTPGNNQKRHLAGSLHWRTGRLILSSAGCRRNSALFIDHLDDLRRTLRCYRVIHVVCDNASFHNSRQVRAYLNGCGGRIVLHFLPKYAPETNPIERIWWHLHEDITRNHRCHSLDELLDNVYDWAANHQTFASQIEHFQALYPLAA